MNASHVVSFLARLAIGLANLVGALLRPVLYLWPWVIACLIYSLFLDSPQGRALGADFAINPPSGPLIFTAVLAVGALLLISTTLALVAAAPAEITSPDRARHAVGGAFWTVGVSAYLPISYAIHTAAPAAWLAAASVVAAGLAAAGLLLTSLGRPGSLANATILFFRAHRLRLALVVGLIALAPIAAGALVCTTNPMQLSDFGALLIALVGLASVSTFFAAALLIIPICLRLPWLGAAALSACLLWTEFGPLRLDEENPRLAERRKQFQEKAREETCRPVPDDLGETLRTAEEAHKRIYLVSAEGGGIRAAYWTAVSLAELDIAHQGTFKDRVALVSGVSGGSLGIATWLAVHERRDLSAQQRLDLVKRFLSSDFLSPLIAGFLFLDTPRLLLGPLWTSSRRDHAFELAIADRWRAIAGTDFFARPLLGLCLHGFKHPPAIYFNATEARTGRWYPLTPITPPPPEAFQDLVEVADLGSSTLASASVAQMVHISARFPYLSPPVELGVLAHDYKPVGKKREKLKTQHKYRLAILLDGGYVDNTGILPIKHALRLIGYHDSWKAEVEIVHLANSAEGACIPITEAARSKLSRAARHFLDTRLQQPVCEAQLPWIESAIGKAPFAWLTAPLSGIVAVRSSHQMASKIAVDQEIQAVKQKHKATIGAAEINVAVELTSRRARSSEGLRRAQENALKVQTERNRQVSLAAKDEAAKALNAGLTDRATADEYLRRVEEWSANNLHLFSNIGCEQEIQTTEPPLGWALTRTAENTMSCLVIHAARKVMPPNSLLAPPQIPWRPGTPRPN